MRRPLVIGYAVTQSRTLTRWVRPGRLAWVYSPNGAATCFPTRDAANAAIKATRRWREKRGYPQDDEDFEVIRLIGSNLTEGITK